MAEICKHCTPPTPHKDIDEYISHLESVHKFNISKEAKFARKA